MKTRQLAEIILTLVMAACLQRAVAQPLNLNNYPSMTYTQTFDTLGFSMADTNLDGSFGSLPSEWATYTNAHPTYPGAVVTWNGGAGQMLNWLNWTNGATGFPTISGNLWSSALGTGSPGGGFFNFASYFDYIGGTNFFTNNTPPGGTTILNSQGYGLSSNVLTVSSVITNMDYQTNQPNRCLGIRQTGSFGDPFAAFVLKIADTVNFHNFSLGLDFLNLDGTSPRQAIWTVDWGIADPVYYVPTSFYPIARYTNTIQSFHWFHTNITFPDGTINNVAVPAGAPPNLAAVWIRIVTLAPSGPLSGNRETFAIDNVGLTWQSGSGGCVAVDGSTGAGIQPGGILSQPTASTVYSNASAAFTVSVAGTSPIFYQWYKDGVGLSDGVTGSGNSSILGSRSYQVLVNNVGPADQGQYSCVISNSCGSTVYVTNSAAASFTITNPPTASLAFLHTLVDPNTFVATNTTAMWRATGIITTLTNLTTGNTASYYLQDATGGINLFVTGGSAFRPNMGDICTIVGFLSTFGGSLELEADLTGAVPANNATLVNDYSNNITAYPVAKVLPWDNLFMSSGTNANLTLNYSGSIVILTNVYFGTNANKVTTAATATYVVTNSSGKLGRLTFPGGVDFDVTNRTMPSFAYSVQGPLVPTSAGYAVQVSRWADLVASPLALNITRSGNTSTITWTAVPLTYSYSVLAATDVGGPYTALTNNLKFSTASGSYVDTDAANHKFYRVTSP